MKKPFIYLLTAGLAISMIVDTDKTFAEGETSSESTEANVTFTLPTDFEVIDPLDPENPDNPEYNEDPDGVTPDLEAVRSGLSIDYVSNIRFGEVELSAIDSQTINATTQAPYIQVTDQRFSEEGWNLTAVASSFASVEDGVRTEKSTLKGSSISLTNTGTDAKDEILNNDNISPPNTNASIKLVAGGESDIVASALSKELRVGDKPQGLGTWLFTWLSGENTEEEGNSNVVLEVPLASATTGEHSSIITWTLTDGPASNHSEIN